MTPETLSILANLVASTLGTYLAVRVQGWAERRRADRGGHMN